jgi:hypothetical protein
MKKIYIKPELIQFNNLKNVTSSPPPSQLL